METYDCPLCQKPHKTLARYSMAVCNTCLQTYPTVNSEGQRLAFGNLGLSGGFYCKNLDTGLMYYDDHVCYVNNTKCFADEARFGGIVICAAEK